MMPSVRRSSLAVSRPSSMSAAALSDICRTAPPQYPAAVDRYVNLGQFYDVTALKAFRPEIIRYTKAVTAAYQRAYRALGAARQMSDSAAALMLEGLDTAKLLRRKIALSLHSGQQRRGIGVR